MICLKTEIELSRVILNGTTNRFLRHFFYTYIWLREPVTIKGRRLKDETFSVLVLGNLPNTVQFSYVNFLAKIAY